jgi:hypothetical protein
LVWALQVATFRVAKLSEEFARRSSELFEPLDRLSRLSDRALNKRTSNVHAPESRLASSQARTSGGSILAEAAEAPPTIREEEGNAKMVNTTRGTPPAERTRVG